MSQSIIIFIPCLFLIWKIQINDKYNTGVLKEKQKGSTQFYVCDILK
jgi:hypothetical protein